MSVVYQPDPHPGRCCNFQERYTVDRGIERRRCLGLSSEPHVCEFDPWPVPLTRRGWGGVTTAPAPAAPWVARPPARPSD